ncbi:hypothetical protein K505DRAFT_416257 [Melanomma pulvis-pyrius CBS 109.77]|uniref:Uncharacterized protein n=1 Tax=Melanomma pulvis-pyrius CBS 109.77 TaxID=1314802 RepID=A0A6A6XH44_9PLEO|nr:hypothetical protein K505DRAFT_416257 [Melanomma pulvis-pyrius CBS 109.77]
MACVPQRRQKPRGNRDYVTHVANGRAEEIRSTSFNNRIRWLSFFSKSSPAQPSTTPRRRTPPDRKSFYVDSMREGGGVQSHYNQQDLITTSSKPHPTRSPYEVHDAKHPARLKTLSEKVYGNEARLWGFRQIFYGGIMASASRTTLPTTLPAIPSTRSIDMAAST